MSRLDDRLTRELERAARPADPANAFQRVDRRRARRHILRRARSVGLVVVVLAGTIGGFAFLSDAFREGSPGLGAASDVSNGAIVYSEVRNAVEHLWVVDADGTDTRQLTTDEGVSDSDPAVSPSGASVAFVRTDQRGSSVYTIGTDGSGLTRLTPAGSPAIAPAWSPDGTKLAFAGVDGGIFVMSVEGSDRRQIVGRSFVVTHLTWSPDGTRIAFAAPGDGTGIGQLDLWLSDAQGVTQVNITGTSDADETSPEWSPDGSRILFSRTTLSGAASLMTIAPDPDASPITMTDGTTLDQNPAWSPDGSRIVFDRTWAGGTDVYTIEPDGSDLALVARNATDPAWQAAPSTASPPVPSPTPSEITPNIDLGFRVCNVQVDGAGLDDFDHDGLMDLVVLATKLSDAGACPPQRQGFNVMAFVNADGAVDASFGPIECRDRCHVLATPDVDGDGSDEIAVAVGTTGGSTEFELFSAPSGVDIQRLGFDCSRCNSGVFVWGGPGGHMEGAYCLPEGVVGDFVTWTAERADDGTHYALAEFVIDVKGPFLVQVDRKDSFVPYDLSSLPEGGGSDFCGAPVASSP
jgi:hypothetical protein